jgi:prepilin-type N-terminal cleavage/methylation domain-containing protein
MRRGMTLLELLVVLLLLGIMSGISALSLRPLLGADRSDPAPTFAQRRDSAALTGRAVLWVDARGHLVRALPDGRVLRAGPPADAP